tara:strand:+ start:690 stop:1271 length:582 start_codon:yes stop_codon:yes gene_type:complete
MSIEVIKKDIKESIEVKQKLLESSKLAKQILELVNCCISSLRADGKIIFCGNGGSFADSQHLSAEFSSRFMFDRPALASIALGTNSSAMSAIANDYGYEDVFSRELEAVATRKDMLVGITTSGNSPNIIKAMSVAESIGIKAFVLTGETGGSLSSFSGCIKVPSHNTARIQESHIMLGHIVCGLVESIMFSDE